MQTSFDAEYPLYNPARALLHTPGARITLLFSAHVVLGYLLYRSSIFGTLHAVAVLLVGLWFVFHDRDPLRVIYVSGYIVGGEVLWRMTHAYIFWEYGKYAVTLLLVAAIVKWRMRLSVMPLLYFVLLLPSVVLTLGEYNLWNARDQISFDLSGPLALAVAAVFFAQLRLTIAQLRQLWVWIIAPIVGVAFLSLLSLRSASSILFSAGSSNFVASGGFGPNQVSAILGLGVLLCWLYFLTDETRSRARWLLLGCAFWFLVHSVLTFSRGGFFNFVAAAPVATLYLLRSSRKQRKSLFGILLILIILLYVLLPSLTKFTGGTLEQRFTNTDTDSRDKLWQIDLQVWQDNFITGVGPGRTMDYYAVAIGVAAAPHTEYSRLLAQHGLFGLLSLILLFVLFIRAFRSAQGARAKGVMLALMLWSLAEMSHSAMRIVAISFIYALPLIQLGDTE